MKTDSKKSEMEILIAEDSPTQAEKLKYILEQHGYHPTSVRNGREALEAIARQQPTLVISDVIMPEMTGYELCHRIKQEEKFRKIPVILLTSLSDPAEVVRGLESGADGFIFKPYDEDYLLARVAYILANRHLRDTDTPQMGVEIFFSGRKFFITSDRLQILNLLLSTYETAVQKNRELTTTQEELRHLNEHLETKVSERTSALKAEIIERKQAQSGLQSQLERLHLLHQITRAIGERQDLQSIFQVVMGSLEKNLPIDFGCVCLHDADSGAFIVSGIGAGSSPLAAEAGIKEQTAIPIVQNDLSQCAQGEMIYEPDIAQAHPPFLQRLARAGLRSLVAAPLPVEGRVFGVLIAARREAEGFDGDEREFLLQLSDHVALAARQAQLNAELEQRVLERTAELEVANKELEAFSHSVSHDLKAPLRQIDGFSQLLIQNYVEQLPEKAQGFLRNVRNRAQYMAQLIDDLLNFSRLGRQSLTKGTVKLSDLVQRVLDDQQRTQEGRQTEIRLGVLPDCEGDSALLQQVFINLLSNAFKFTRHREPAIIEIGCMQDQGETVYFVRDNGAGFDMQYAKNLFGVFQRFHKAEEFEGTGVGLSIVQRIIHRHGGRIWAESQQGEGTTFYFTLAPVASKILHF